MKKIFSFLTLIFVFIIGKAQHNYFHQQPLFMYGFRLAYNVPFEKQYSTHDFLSESVYTEFGAFFRTGKYVYGEVGINYSFHKTTFNSTITDTIVDAFAELRYIQIPIRVLGYLPIGNEMAFTPNVGVIYQPLVAVKNNDAFYQRDAIQKHQFLFSAGLGFRFHFLSLELNYRKMLRNFYNDRDGKKPNYLNITLGFQF